MDCLHKFLREVPEHQCFWLNSDHWQPVAKVNSLEDMIRGLEKAHPHVVVHHMREYNNDFSNWVYDVIGDAVLASDIRSIRGFKASELHAQILNTFKKRVDLLKGTADFSSLFSWLDGGFEEFNIDYENLSDWLWGDENKPLSKNLKSMKKTLLLIKELRNQNKNRR